MFATTTNLAHHTHHRGGAASVTGDIYIHSRAPESIGQPNSLPILYTAYWLAYHGPSFAHVHERRLTWQEIRVASWNPLPTEVTVYTMGSSMNAFVHGVTGETIAFPVVTLRDPVYELQEGTMPSRPVGVAVVAYVARGVKEMAGFDKTVWGDVQFGIVPKTGDRHESEREWVVDVVIKKAMITNSKTHATYLNEGTSADVSGPVLDFGRGRPLTVFTNEYTPSPLSTLASQDEVGGAVKAVGDMPPLPIPSMQDYLASQSACKAMPSSGARAGGAAGVYYR